MGARESARAAIHSPAMTPATVPMIQRTSLRCLRANTGASWLQLPRHGSAAAGVGRWEPPSRRPSHGYVPPATLMETRRREHTTREVTDDDGHPDPGGLQLPGRLRVEADPQRNGDLRDERDVQRAPRIAGSLETARVRQG